MDGQRESTGHTRRPRRRNREATERRIVEATWRLFERSGPLAGLNLQRVADEAGVNRSLVYQYFGSGEQLLRTAMAHQLDMVRPLYQAGLALPFAERRRQSFAIAMSDPAAARLIVQLILAEDPEVRALPLLDETRVALKHDLDTGSLPPDADADVMHAMTAVLSLGYSVFRDRLALELDIELDDLDRRAMAVFQAMVRGMLADDHLSSDDAVIAKKP